uniref:helix-turn-helix domain-containing protein n=1 Tax=Acetatifactor sp. TaxID=1872090 RepID=UPI00405633DC
MNSIGKKIRTLRRNKNLTQEQFAEVLSVSAQAVSKWENALSVPDITVLPMIARYFGITMDELFNYRLDALNYKERFIRFMADNGVLKFGEFKLQSGRVSPYFINTGNYKSGSQISKLGEFYAECIREKNISGNLLVGNTGQEIPLLISTGMILYSKYGVDINYGIDNTMGKILDAGDEMILIKDTLSSGKTLKTSLRRIQEEAGKSVSDVIVSVDRMERGCYTSLSALHEIEKEFDVKIHPIVTVDDIMDALENGVIAGEEYLEAMREYKKTYGGC